MTESPPHALNNPPRGGGCRKTSRQKEIAVPANRQDGSSVGRGPVRIQRKRVKGWRMPENTVYVGRPSKWGNPFTPRQYWDAGYSGDLNVALGHCINAYSAWVQGYRHWVHKPMIETPPNISELRGKNLCCWCPLHLPCHADVLLELANA